VVEFTRLAQPVARAHVLMVCRFGVFAPSSTGAMQLSHGGGDAPTGQQHASPGQSGSARRLSAITDDCDGPVRAALGKRRRMSRALKGRNKVRRGQTSTDRQRSMGVGVSSSRDGRQSPRLVRPLQGSDGLGPRSQGGADRSRDALGSVQRNWGRSALPWARLWLPRWGVTSSSDNDASP